MVRGWRSSSAHGKALLLLQAKAKERPLVSRGRWEASQLHHPAWSWMLELSPKTSWYYYIVSIPPIRFLLSFSIFISLCFLFSRFYEGNNKKQKAKKHKKCNTKAKWAHNWYCGMHNEGQVKESLKPPLCVCVYCIFQVCRGVGRAAGWGGSITWGLIWREEHSHSRKRIW